MNFAPALKVLSLLIATIFTLTSCKVDNAIKPSETNYVADLTNIKVAEADLAFAGSNTNYTLYVASDVNTATFTITASDNLATIKVNGEEKKSGEAFTTSALSEGSNIFNVLSIAKDGKTKKLYVVEIIKGESANPRLSKLISSRGTLSPAFTPDVGDYTIDVAYAVSSLYLTPTADADGGKIKVNGVSINSGYPYGPMVLSPGKNVATIVSTAKDKKTSKTYTVTVNRDAGTNANLSSLSILNGLIPVTMSPSFTKDTVAYSANVPFIVSAVDIFANTETSDASITINSIATEAGSNQNINLSVGSNIIPIIVTSANGTTKTYNVNIVRYSSDANLSALTISQGTLAPAFASGTTSYTAWVLGAVTSLNITPTANHSGASIKINNVTTISGSAKSESLNYGDNVFTILVTAQDLSYTKTYTVTIRRKSDVSTLSNLSLSTGSLSPVFASGTLNYTSLLNFADNAVNATPTATNSSATITVNGASVVSGSASGAINLNLGDNTITTIVTSEDGTSTKTYTITATRRSNDAALVSLVPSAGALSPAFASGTNSYTMEFDSTVNSVDLTATRNESHATIKINTVNQTSGTAKTINLNTGDNIVNVAVTSWDTTVVNTYTITIHKKSADVNLINLTTSSGSLSPSFAQNTTAYNVSVVHAVNSITVTPTMLGSSVTAGATITVNGGAVISGNASGAINLNDGDNTITVVTTAEDTSFTKTYTLTVRRLLNISTLSNLSISAGAIAPAFNSGTTAYTIDLPFATNSTTATPTITAASNATVTINGAANVSGNASGAITLNVGDNTITAAVTSEDGTSTTNYVITATRRSNDALLSNLVPSVGSLSPSFASGTNAYSISLDSTQNAITFTPTKNESHAAITVDGQAVNSGSASQSINLSTGNNVILIVVTAWDNSYTNTYTITVHKKSGDALLTNLSTNAGAIAPVFDSNTTSYTMNVANAVSTIKITPTMLAASAAAGATITVNGSTVASGAASSNINLSDGDNTITVLVTAEDTAITKTYTLTVHRQSNVSTLTNLVPSVGSLSPVFNSGTIAYTLDESFATNSITITPTVAASSSATIKVNNVSVASANASGAINLNVGDNTITIVVTSEDTSTTTTYTITATRRSNDALLANLTASAGSLSPVFDSGTNSYTMSFASNVASVDLTATRNESHASITINGQAQVSGNAKTINLSTGDNVVSIVVTAWDTSITNTYTVTIHKKSGDADLTNLSTNAGAFAPVFASATTAYSMSVPFATSTATVTPTMLAASVTAGATITVNGGAVVSGNASGAINLSVGDNTITIVATAEDAAITKTYTLTIHRKSNVSTLSNLSTNVGSLSPAFDSGTIAYTVDLPFANNSITITPTVTAASNATITVNGNAVTSGNASGAIALNVGDNTITTIVTSEDTTTNTTYTLTVHRKSNVSTLSNLTISNGTLAPVFDSGTISYNTSHASNVNSVTVTPTVTAASNATITVNGNAVISANASGAINLNVGDNTITIVVTSEDTTTTTTYTITAHKISANADLSGITLSSGVLAPVFGAGTTSYNVNVPNATTSIDVTAIKAYSLASVTTNGTSVNGVDAAKTVNLNVGDNSVSIVVTAEDGTTTKTYTVTVRRLNNNADLTNLSATAGAISPVFDSNTIAYTMTVANAVNATTITPTLSDTNASIKVNTVTVASGAASGSIALNAGDNVITTVVTAEDTSITKTYTLTIHRKSSDTTLSSLTISNGTLAPVFDSGTTSYNTSHASNINSVTVTPTATAAASGATIKVNTVSVTSGQASGILNLSTGDNTISIVVTAEDTSFTNTYTITAHKISANADLSGITLSTGTLAPVFGAGTTAYTVSYPYATNSIDVTAIKAYSLATVTTNGTSVNGVDAAKTVNLNVGDNTITIIVTAEDGTTTKTYTITATRKSNDANLSNLTASAGSLSPVFDSGTNTYTMSFASNVASVDLTPTRNEAHATITVNGQAHTSGNAKTINLSAGDNVVTIVVTAWDTSITNTYTVTIHKKSADADLSALTVSAGTLSPAFNSATTAYSISQLYAVTAMTVTPTSSGVATGATITVNGQAVTSANASQSINLNVGDNTITIVVTAEDTAVTKTYTITVVRMSNNADLSNLSASAVALAPVFGANTTSYSMSVGYLTDATTITPTLADANASVKVNNVSVASAVASGSISLNVGDNTITVLVTAQDSNYTKTYTITIHRKSNVSSLSALSLSSGNLSPAFDSGTTSYTETYEYATSAITVTPTATAAAAGATITVNTVSVTSGQASGNLNLSAGANAITIVVTAEDSSYTTSYTFTATRKSNDATLIGLSLSDGRTLSPVFASGTTSYTSSGVNALSSITVTPTRNEGHATITVNGQAVTSGQASQAIAVNTGNNTITIVVTAWDTSYTETYTITYRRLSNIATLSNMTISNGTLSPAFDSGTTAYAANGLYAVNSLDVTSTLTQANATFTVNGAAASSAVAKAVALNAGANVITVSVTSEDATVNTNYVLTYTRYSNDADLSNLTVSAGTLSPVFASGTIAYTLPEASTVNSITFTPTVNESHATITVNGQAVTSANASQAINLNLGDNTVTIVVTAWDTNYTKTYTITVHKKSGDADLSALTVSAGTLSPAFNSGTISYSVSQLYVVTAMTVTPTSSGAAAGATITVNGQAVTSANASQSINLNVGNNTITVVVTAEDTAVTKTYTINTVRLNNNADLSALSASAVALSPVFGANTTSYSMSVPYVTDATTITPTLADTNASVKVNGVTVASGAASGSITLNVGDNTITVLVTAQDVNYTKTYSITIHRKSNVSTLANLTISVGSLSPAFASGTYSYNVSEVSTVASVTVTPTTTNASATITVNGQAVTSGQASQSLTINLGDNTVTVISTAEDSTYTSTYTVTVRRKSNVSTLSNFTISQGTLSPVFNSGTITYTSSVVNAVNSFTVTPTATQANATITVNAVSVTSGQASGSLSLNTGDNTITTVVTSEDGTSTTTYTLTQRRKSNVSTLSGLTLSTGTLSPVFNSGTITYTANGPYANATVDVTSTVTQANATVSLNAVGVVSGAAITKAVSVGSNTFTVVVTSEDASSTTTYTTTYTRYSNDANLSNLTVTAGTLSPAFAAGTISYTLPEAYAQTSIKVTPTKSHASATITVNGQAVTSGSQSQQLNLNVGDNTITIIVTAQDTSITKTYTITAHRKSNDTSITNIVISNGGLNNTNFANKNSFETFLSNTETTSNMTITLGHAQATMTINGTSKASGAVYTQDVSGTFAQASIIVTAEDTTITKSYSVDFKKIASVFIPGQTSDWPYSYTPTDMKVRKSDNMIFISDYNSYFKYYDTTGTPQNQFIDYGYPINAFTFDSSNNLFAALRDWVNIMDSATPPVNVASNWDSLPWDGTAPVGSKMYSPKTITVNAANTFLIDRYGSTSYVKKYTNAGAYVTGFSSGGYYPGIASDAFWVYISDYYAGNIIQYDTGFNLIGAAATGLNKPMGLMVNGGNLYIADSGNSRIKKFTTGGAYQAAFGTTGYGDGKLNTPIAVDVDTNGNVYALDKKNKYVQVFNSAGTAQYRFGTPSKGADYNLTSPNAVTEDASGNLFVADTGNNSIKKFNSSGTFLMEITGSDIPDVPLSSPKKVAINPYTGDIFVTDAGHCRIVKFNSSGAYVAKTTTDNCGTGVDQLSDIASYGINGIVTDGSYIHLTDAGNHRIVSYSTNLVKTGNYGTTGAYGCSTNGKLYFPMDLDIYPGDYSVIVVLNSACKQVGWVWNNYNGTLAAGVPNTINMDVFSVSWPISIAVDWNGTGAYHIADAGNNTIIKYASNYILQGYMGSGTGSGNNQYKWPSGVIITSDNKMIITDRDNHRIHRIAPY